MGNAHARQQALREQSRGSSMGVAGVAGVPGAGIPPATGGGPPPDAAASVEVAGDGQDERIPVVFTWTHGGQNVALAAGFTGWKDPIPMVRSGNEFAVVQELPRGVHQYKFIVDNQWRYAPDQPKLQDGSGNMNNVIDISRYQRFQVLDETDPPPKFGQVIPDPNDYTLDAPSIPTVLHKSAYCALPPRPISNGVQPPCIPSHSLCDHIYLQERVDDNVPTTVAVTHRYGQKYSTTVYATKSPRGASCATARKNPLKATVVRRPEMAQPGMVQPPAAQKDVR